MEIVISKTLLIRVENNKVILFFKYFDHVAAILTNSQNQQAFHNLENALIGELS